MKPLYLVALVATLYCCACNSQQEQFNNNTITSVENTSPISDTAYQEVTSASPAISDAPNTSDQQWDAQIIKTADIRLETNQYQWLDYHIREMIRKYGGYIAAEELMYHPEQKANKLTIKVPVKEFDALVQAISTDSCKVLHKAIQSENVTEAIMDTKARIATKKQVRDQYLVLLKQARNMEDILKVQSEINAIQEQMEAATGRLQYLGKAAAYSTINLEYQLSLTTSQTADLQPGLLKQLAERFQDGASFILLLMLFLVQIWPVILIGIFVVLLWKRNKLNTTANKS